MFPGENLHTFSPKNVRPCFALQSSRLHLNARGYLDPKNIFRQTVLILSPEPCVTDIGKRRICHAQQDPKLRTAQNTAALRMRNYSSENNFGADGSLVLEAKNSSAEFFEQDYRAFWRAEDSPSSLWFSWLSLQSARIYRTFYRLLLCCP